MATSWTDIERKSAYENLLAVVVPLDHRRPITKSSLVDCDQRSIAIFRLSCSKPADLEALLSEVLLGRSCLENNFGSLSDIALRVERKFDIDGQLPKFVYTI